MQSFKPQYKNVTSPMFPQTFDYENVWYRENFERP